MTDIEFARWEGDSFGFGYGTGEHHTIPVLKKFLGLIPGADAYDYELLEKEMGAAIAWLLINMLCRHPRDMRACRDSVITYGMSPRFGFLTELGLELKGYVDSRTSEELMNVLASYDASADDIYCVEQ